MKTRTDPEFLEVLDRARDAEGRLAEMTARAARVASQSRRLEREKAEIENTAEAVFDKIEDARRWFIASRLLAVALGEALGHSRDSVKEAIETLYGHVCDVQAEKTAR